MTNRNAIPGKPCHAKLCWNIGPWETMGSSKKTHLYYILFPNDHEIHQQKLPQNNGLFPKHKFTCSGFSLTSPAPSLMCFFNSPPCHHAFFAALAPPRFAPYPPSTPPQDHCKRSFSVNLWMEVSGHGVFRRRWIMKVKNRFPS